MPFSRYEFRCRHFDDSFSPLLALLLSFDDAAAITDIFAAADSL